MFFEQCAPRAFHSRHKKFEFFSCLVHARDHMGSSRELHSTKIEFAAHPEAYVGACAWAQILLLIIPSCALLCRCCCWKYCHWACWIMGSMFVLVRTRRINQLLHLTFLFWKISTIGWERIERKWWLDIRSARVSAWPEGCMDLGASHHL